MITAFHRGGPANDYEFGGNTRNIISVDMTKNSNILFMHVKLEVIFGGHVKMKGGYYLKAK